MTATEIKDPRRRAIAPALLAIIALTSMATSGRLAHIRAVDALSIFGAGMCVGVAFALLMVGMKQRAATRAV